MKLLKFITAFLCFLTLAASALGADVKIEIKRERGNKSHTLESLQKKLPVLSYTVKEFAYKKEKTFEGFPVLKLLELDGGIPADIDEVLFVAADGFEAPISIAQLKAHDAILAFQEKGRSGRWEKFPHGKEMITPAPFYLVWREGGEMVGDSNWPYQVVRLELISFAKKYQKMYPAGAGDQVMQGFRNFKSNCMQCHSMNLEGGVVGPELNAPKNVTEYWTKDNLVAFIKNSNTFRFRSKMPPFPRLSDGDIDSILKYLEFMKDRKIAAP